VDGQQRVPQSETELQEFFDLSIDLLCIVGFDGYFKRVNASFERTLGYPKAELFSRSVFDITHPDDVPPSREALARLGQGHDLVGYESRVICADGSVRWLEWNTRTMPERGVVFGVARDTTERRRADAELREAQRMLEASRDELRVLADEQAALRRVATLVARETPPDEVFAAVVREVGEVLGVDATHLGRYDADGMVVSIAQGGRYPSVPIGARFPLEGDSVSARVLRTGRPARMDGYEDAPGVIAATIRETGIRYSIGVPISVQGRPWGVMIATSKNVPFPAETESRLQDFTELVATAIANAQARSELRQLVEEQRALRRVATLVARAASQDDAFDVVVQEAYRLFGEDVAFLLRYESDGTPVIAAIRGAPAEFTPGTRLSREGDGVPVRVWRTGRAARLDSYENVSGRDAARARSLGVRGSAGAPIVVAGRVWGVIVVMTRGDALPVATEGRLAQFAELVAAAIANADARAEVARLANEQAALRRVATLVAQGAAPSAVFEAVTAEVAEVLDASAVSLARYDDDVLTVVAHRGAAYLRTGERFSLGGTNVPSTVLRTGRTARLDDVAQATGPIGEAARGAGVRSVVGAPVVVDGRTWGVLAAIWTDRGPPPDDTEERMARFAELLDTAIANADSRDQLTASRARVLAAGDEARRRVVRDLHDGAQQRLVHTIITLKLAQRGLREDRSNAEALVAEALGTAERATAEVRELAHGILPSVLTHAGLRAGVNAFASRLDLPVDLDVLSERLPPDMEASAYFVVAEALTNVVKHARATRATVRAAADDGVLTLEVRDDGVGGANPEGHGLMGIADRVDALGGRLRIESADGDGTVLTARLPLTTRSPQGKSSNDRLTNVTKSESRLLRREQGPATA
jgi:PAS domain S-box-containing protein